MVAVYPNLKKLASDRLYVGPREVAELYNKLITFNSGATDDYLKKHIKRVMHKWMQDHLLKLHA